MPPKNARLRGLYQKARRIADCIEVTQWRHHYREFNKMADLAASQAMDTKLTQQALVSAGCGFTAEIIRLLPGDYQQWKTNSANTSTTTSTLWRHDCCLGVTSDTGAFL